MITKTLCLVALLLAIAQAGGPEYEGLIDMSAYEGEVIKGSNNDAQYLVLDGELRYISAYSKAHCFTHSFTTIDQVIMDEMPVGKNLPADCALVKAPTGQVFFPDNCTDINGADYVCWRWVYNPETFNKYHLNWNTIVDVPQVLIDSALHGDTINP